MRANLNGRLSRPGLKSISLAAGTALLAILASGSFNSALAKQPRGNNSDRMKSPAAGANRSVGSGGNFSKSPAGKGQADRQSAASNRYGNSNRDASGGVNKSIRSDRNAGERNNRNQGFKGRQNDNPATAPRYVPKNNIPATGPKAAEQPPVPIRGPRLDRDGVDKMQKAPTTKHPSSKAPDVSRDNKLGGKPPFNAAPKDWKGNNAPKIPDKEFKPANPSGKPPFNAAPKDWKGNNAPKIPHKEFKPVNPIGKPPHGADLKNKFAPKNHSLHKPLPQHDYKFPAYGKKHEHFKPGQPPHVYRGPVAPKYKHDSFRHHYHGPKAYIGIQLYPRWSPWVEWSWGYRCRTIYDPRPIVCRPVVYRPIVTWVYWETPVWTPLPEYCGTWAAMRPVEPVAANDLQLVAVRFIDPGHPDQRLGPRYRVWFRNNAAANVNQPFDVMLFAANDERLSAELPRAGVRVAAVAAGATQSVDIRLPPEVYAMNRDAAGNPAPFAALHVLVDAANELAEVDESNNGAQLSPGEIAPIDPAAFDLRPATAKVGGEVELAGEGFGPQPGRVLLIVAGQEIDAEIVGWYDLGVRFAVPAAAAGAKAEVVVIRPDGTATNPLPIAILP